MIVDDLNSYQVFQRQKKIPDRLFLLVVPALTKNHGHLRNKDLICSQKPMLFQTMGNITALKDLILKDVIKVNVKLVGRDSWIVVQPQEKCFIVEK